MKRSDRSGSPSSSRSALLQDRVDAKYVISLEQLAALTRRLRATHAVLEIAGRRAFRYRTVYFDTGDLRIFRDHVQERRRRYKARAREYVDSGLCMFEVKLKGSRGRTVKRRMAYDHAPPDELSGPALAFLRECLERSYGRAPDARLRPTLAVGYTRVTLVSPTLGERLTCDFDLAFSAPDGRSGRLAPDRVIVESKSPRGNAAADRALRALGARPERCAARSTASASASPTPTSTATGCDRCCDATSTPRRSPPCRSRSAPGRSAPPAAQPDGGSRRLRASRTCSLCTSAWPSLTCFSLRE